jgi:putative SOS response-associated peptidase YedK
MCGRFAQTISLSKLNMINLVDEVSGIYSVSYNVAPSHEPSIILNIAGKKNLKPVKWGLIPSWTKGQPKGGGIINARFESVTDKPSFRNSYRYRRCLIPVTGFFEWKKEGRLKIPFFINTGKDDDGEFSVMLLGGLFDTWTSPDGKNLDTFTIITTEGAGAMKTIHDRMPLIIDKKNALLWLSNDYNHEKHKDLILTFNADSLKLYPVSESVNSPGNNSVQCIMPAGG